MWFSMTVNLVCDFFCCKCFVSFCCWWHLDSCRRFVLTLDLSRWSWPHVCVVKTKSCELNSSVHVVDDGCHGEYGMRDGWNEEPCNTLWFSMIVNLVCDFFCCKCFVSFCWWWHLDSCRRFVLTLAVSRWSWPYVCVVKMKSCEMNSFHHIRYKHDIGCLIHGILVLSIFWHFFWDKSI